MNAKLRAALLAYLQEKREAVKEFSDDEDLFASYKEHVLSGNSGVVEMFKAFHVFTGRYPTYFEAHGNQTVRLLVVPPRPRE